MVRRSVVEVYDDLDGRKLDDNGGTVRFSLEGRNYEIDLHEDNRAVLRQTFAPYIEAARRTAGRSLSRSKPPNSKLVRAWAKTEGIKVSANGRLSSDLLARYHATHG